MSTQLVDLAGLQTERRNPNSSDIDQVSTVNLCQIINREDATISSAVAKYIPVIAAAIDVFAARVRRGGRVVYVGAGTSGRLGVLDASEIPPTYSAPEGQFIGLIAGGDAALRHAQEGAEDDVDAAVRDLESLRMDGEKDSLIGIAASGRTPYVLSCLSYAKARGCATVGVACVEPSAMSTCGHVDYMIGPVVGPEVVTGSTRMKAGTATKLVLNMLSTGTMIRIGKTFGNMMVDLKATNLKLQQRSRNILRNICGSACPWSDSDLDALLNSCGGSVKLAIATLSLNVDVGEAKRRLHQADDVLANVLKKPVYSESRNGTSSSSSSSSSSSTTDEKDGPEYVLCVDGGGSKCAAVVMSSSSSSDGDGAYGYGEAGGCNVTDVGVEAAIASISLAVQRAVDTHPVLHGSRPSLFSSIWVALAGHDRKELGPLVERELERLFNRRPMSGGGGGYVKVTNDIELLAASAAEKHHVDSVVVLVAGTGSVAMRFRRVQHNDQHERQSSFVRVARSGGWGHLLGDDGSGFDIGRQGIRRALAALDVHRSSSSSTHPLDALDAEDKTPFKPPTPMVRRILDHFRPPTTSSAAVDRDRESNGDYDHDYEYDYDYDFLSAVLSSTTGADTETKKAIAQTARIVIDSSTAGDSEAKHIVDSAVGNLLSLLDPLVTRRRTSTCQNDPPDVKTEADAILVLAGGLMQSEVFVQSIKSALVETPAHARFKDVVVVEQPALMGAEMMLRQLEQRKLMR